VEVLAELPTGHPLRAELVERAQKLAAALHKVAEPSNGLFHTLLLDRDSYLETAGSALIVYGLARGVRAGLLGEADASLARRGMRGLLGVLESHPSGMEVSGTSLGTNPNVRRYKTIRRKNQVSYGVGAWLLAASELLALARRIAE
jgi:unsaturated rhamnogalacturonyl hydrolase